MYSWRFWAKGIKKGNLICGVAKDSSDTMGRAYPLIIMGDGMLDGWEEHWDLLPHAFEATWAQIEYISSRRFESLKGLEHEVFAIKAPKPDWREVRCRNRNRENSQSLPNALTISNHNDEINEKAACLSKEMEVLVPLDIHTHEDFLSVAGHWNFVFKDHGLDIPNAVFLGGIPEKHFLAVFNRPLNSKDFVRLWSVSFL
jgi:type VI secretion system protein VasJ